MMLEFIGTILVIWLLYKFVKKKGLDGGYDWL